MPAAKDKPDEVPVPEQQRDHDRVAMLSIRADGTPDQVDPELIGDQPTVL